MTELHLIVRLWLHPEAQVADFEELEREAASIMSSYGGTIEWAFRATTGLEDGEPFEVHLVSFPDDAAFDAYRADARTLSLKERRDKLIACTEVWRGSKINYGF